MNYRLGHWSRSRSLAFVVALYAVAITAALVVAAAVSDPYGDLILGYAASVVVLYVVSQIVGNGSTFDAWWSVLPPVIAFWFVFTLDDTSDVRRWLVALCALAWGVRLTANWAIGWPGLNHEDWRYVKLYADAPMIVVTLGSLPMVTAASIPGRSLNVFDVLAVVFALTGTALEHFADVDLRRFNRTKQPGDVLDFGLWSRSRHPNYLGEMLWWWGLFFFALAADPGSWWTGIGALAMTVMFLTASIPFAEKRSMERRPGWSEYCERTPLLIPRLRSR
jgi:steroid 5-alpha reductase family enzyme